ncbi:hypothetical protein FRC03_000376 [Tulasnella sp. 419]|nr:hypothetical protein FRC03_000376 [Tulasnella sp. 419]
MASSESTTTQDDQGNQRTASSRLGKQDPPSYRTPPIPPEFGYGMQYWSEYLDVAQIHDKEFAGRVHTQLDSLLTFAGLFSGINTGFMVLSLGVLSPTPTEQTNALLRILLSQTNVSTAILEQASPPWSLKPAGVRSSSFLASSLSCGLLASVGVIFGKQWLAYYERSSAVGNLEDRVVNRQNLTDGFYMYSVHEFLYSLSILIQIAVLIFLVGFIDYLYDLHTGVALVVISIVCLGGLVYACTVVSAALDPECPFQTPVSMLLRRIVFLIQAILRLTRALLTSKPFNSRFSHQRNLPVKSSSVRYSSEKDASKKRRSYARSVRWILETTSRPSALLEAARNIPALQDIKSTRRIFATTNDGHLRRLYQYIGNKGLSTLLPLSTESNPLTEISQKFFSMPSYPDDSLAYNRLVSLFRGSLARYVTQQNSQGASKDLVHETIVYGRAVCHALITRNGAPEAFERLSERLGDFASLAWMEGLDGELRLLLMFTLNHPRFWLYPDHLDVAFNAIDVSTLPMYIAGISIASLVASASDRALWVNRLIHRSLNTLDPAPRMIGVAAKALIHIEQGIRQVEKERMLFDFWYAYSSGDKYIFYVLEALERYPLRAETIPNCIEAYSALVKAFRVATKELHTTRDDFYPLEVQAQRRAHRDNLRNLGSQILQALEKILIEVSELILLEVSIDRAPLEAAEITSTPTPTHEEVQHILPDPKGLRPFIEEILLAIEDGLGEYRWGDEAIPSGNALWRTAQVVEHNSESLRILLELMSKTVEDVAQYSTLFRDHPPVATVLTAALNSSDAQVRENALLLIGRKAQEWFEDPFISQSFVDSRLDEYLVWHLQSGDTPHRSVRSLVAKLESKLEWRIKLHKAFHGLALSSRCDSSTAGLVELSLYIWHRFSVLPMVPEMESIMLHYNWYSDEMVSKVTDYVLHRVEAYRVYSVYDAAQMNNVGISESLQAYVKHVKCMQMAHQTAVVQSLLQAIEQLEELLNFPINLV